MKSKDIETGVVYAYSRRSYGEPEAVVVIATDTLYEMTLSATGPTRFRPTAADRPRSAHMHSVGYAVIVEGWSLDIRHDVKLAALRELAAMDPADLRALLESERPELPAGLHFTVINNRNLIGEYDAIKAEQAAAQQREAQRLAQQDEIEGRRREVAAATLAELAKLGVVAKAHKQYGFVTTYEISQDIANLLIQLLSAAK